MDPILIIEDCQEVRDAVRSWTKKYKVQVEVPDTLEEVKELLKKTWPMVLCDYDIKMWTGEETGVDLMTEYIKLPGTSKAKIKDISGVQTGAFNVFGIEHMGKGRMFEYLKNLNQ